jgi:hypothetical protein
MRARRSSRTGARRPSSSRRTRARTFRAFVRAVGALLTGQAARKGYHVGAPDGPNPLYAFTARLVGGPGHALGEIVYKAQRYAALRRDEDVLKIAAWAFLIWRHASSDASDTRPSTNEASRRRRQSSSTLGRRGRRVNGPSSLGAVGIGGAIARTFQHARLQKLCTRVVMRGDGSKPRPQRRHRRRGDASLMVGPVNSSPRRIVRRHPSRRARANGPPTVAGRTAGSETSGAARPGAIAH